jgi:hypothetical protein
MNMGLYMPVLSLRRLKFFAFSFSSFLDLSMVQDGGIIAYLALNTKKNSCMAENSAPVQRAIGSFKVSQNGIFLPLKSVFVKIIRS